MYSLHNQNTLYCSDLRFGLYILACISSLLLGCRKESDSKPPVIVISSPSEGDTFYYLNTIIVHAEISDDSRLDKIIVEVTNSANTRFLESYAINPEDRTQTVHWTTALDDLYLESGTYFIKITASDGENESIEFQEIQLIGAPRILERVCIIRADGATTAVDTLQGNVPVAWFNDPSNYAFGGIDSRTNHLVMCGTDPSQLRSLAYPDLQTLNGTAPLNSAVFNAFFHDRIDHKFYWGDTQGQLFVTDRTSTRLFSPSPLAGSIHAIAANTNKLIVASTAGSSTYLNVFAKTGSLPELSITADWSINALHPLGSDNQLIVLGGIKNGVGHFAYLNLNTGAINENFNFYEPSPVRSIAAAEGDNFYALQDAGLVRYNGNFSSYIMNTELHPTAMIYDELNQTLWTTDATGVRLMNVSLSNELLFVPANGIKDVWLKYNK